MHTKYKRETITNANKNAKTQEPTTREPQHGLARHPAAAQQTGG